MDHPRNPRKYHSTAVLDEEPTRCGSNGEIFSKSEWAELVNKLALSPRQAEVIRRILSGCSDKQIAMDLQIGVPTVRTHINRTFLRFGVQDRIELVIYVFRKFRQICSSMEPSAT